MDREAYLSGVAELYAGEVIGEGLGSRWLEIVEAPAHKYKLALFLQLESEAKVRLRPFLARLGLSLVERASDRGAGVSAAEQFSALPWKEAMQSFADLSRPYLQRYEALLAAAPAEDAAIVGFMVAHERAVVVFAERESQSDPNAIRGLLQLLTHPIPPDI